MRPRLIPVLLLDRDRRLVKTLRFRERTYVGDPFNVLRLFNEKEVDEICILDIDATPDRRAPDLGYISELASECFMPLSYGGGLCDVSVCEQIGRAGVEKFVIGAQADNLELLTAMRDSFGSQAVVACLDYSGSIAIDRTATGSAGSLADRARRVVDAGAGELILQSIDRDGTRGGMDLQTIAVISAAVDSPVVALGGAGETHHLMDALRVGASAAASGSAFTFIGRLRAVLINYPDGGQYPYA